MNDITAGEKGRVCECFLSRKERSAFGIISYTNENYKEVVRDGLLDNTAQEGYRLSQ